MAYENLLLDFDGPVALLTINRPETLNALSPAVVQEIDAAVTEVENNDAIKALVITGAGRAFVAGADISHMVKCTGLEGRHFALQGQAVLNHIERLPKPVVAAVNGFALGGGCELAMACDFIFASEKAKFGQPEINLAIVPGFGGTQRLSRLVGKGWAKYLCLTGEIINAAEAAQIGLVTKVFPPDELIPAASKAAMTMATKGRMALRAIKQLINDGFDIALERGLSMEAEIFATCFTSPDQKEGMTAFLEKRKPDFQGELNK
ncbi:MAG: enoyl-CoA hydratase/isomerase family protein [Deltaproteobacteria bacterium]|nr:enoyl-CoA hydratase/isomerase family protein [Deltaproteobacteria bacterium]